MTRRYNANGKRKRVRRNQRNTWEKGERRLRWEAMLRSQTERDEAIRRSREAPTATSCDDWLSTDNNDRTLTSEDLGAQP